MEDFMLKQWAIVIGLSTGIAASTSAIAGGDECASKQVRADKAVPSAEQSTAQSQTPAPEAPEKSKRDLATN